MTELLPPVDSETLVRAYLMHSLEDLLPTTGTGVLRGISGRLPRSWTPSQTWIRLNLFRTANADRGVGHVTAARLELEIFGDNATELYAIAGRVFRDLLELPSSGWEYPGAVVTDVREDGGIANRPDPDSDGERYTVGVILTSHPRPE